MTTPSFTCDWFTAAAILGPGRWEKHVLPLLRRFEAVSWLEIGAHEGRSALWAAENIVRGPGAAVTCVDAWEYPWLNDVVERRFDANVAGQPLIKKLKGRSCDVLPRLPPASFQGIYVDGCHELEDVAHDAGQAMRLVVPGGVLILDDYQHCWNDGSPLADGEVIQYPGVREAAARLLRERGDELRIVYCGWQLILQVRG